MEIRCGNFLFLSNFDSGNLARVEEVPKKDGVGVSNNEDVDYEFNIWTLPDCAGTEFENSNRTWFYFGIKGGVPYCLVKLNIINLNRQSKMYSQGMAPVFRIVPGKAHWERIRDKPTFNTDDNLFTLSFKFRMLENVRSTIYFAFTYPYSYTDLQAALHNIDMRMQKPKDDTKEESPRLRRLEEIYYHRECVCYSLEGRRVDLITISSTHNITSLREPRLANLFPDQSVLRPFRFTDKKVVFTSGRVHPGETPSSYALNGLLQLLVTRDDPQAAALRRLYVFKLIPMLNPDGVTRGHYRTDTRGVNLNRVYTAPSPQLHPTIYAARSLVLFYHHGYEVNEEANRVSWSIDGSTEAELHRLALIEDRVSGLCLERVSCSPRSSASTSPSSPPHDSPNAEICDQPPSPLLSRISEVKQKEKKPEARQGAPGLITSMVAVGRPVTEPNDSGLFLYVDFHGHASKKGIFMYGNHFESSEDSVECMLLPKLISLNSQNFHFNGCNFTERNMYLKDRRDGMSREGSGRVAVFKATGLVRSYTLECNYNSGRIVNILPLPHRDTKAGSPQMLMPPKYNPQVYEEVGKALGVAILDLGGANPNSRVPNSEFRSINGLREWLRMQVVSENSMLFSRIGQPSRPPKQIQVSNHQLANHQVRPPVPLGTVYHRHVSHPVKIIMTEKKENSSMVKPKSKLVRSASSVLQVRAKCAVVNAIAGSSKVKMGRKKVSRDLENIVLKKGPKRVKMSSEEGKTKSGWATLNHLKSASTIGDVVKSEEAVLAWRAIGRLEKKSAGDNVQRRKKPKPK